MLTLLGVSETEEGVVTLHLPIGPLKPRSRLKPVPRCEPSTYQPISRLCISSCTNACSKSNIVLLMYYLVVVCFLFLLLLFDCLFVCFSLFGFFLWVFYVLI